MDALFHYRERWLYKIGSFQDDEQDTVPALVLDKLGSYHSWEVSRET